MKLELPIWATLPLMCTSFVVSYWFLTVPGAVGLATLGWYAPPWLGRLRWLALGVAALLSITFVAAAIVVALDEIRSAEISRTYMRILDRDETIAGLSLHAGSKIWFRDKQHTEIQWAQLSRATDIAGVPFIGDVWWDNELGTWSGSLARDHRIDGWPCRIGPVGIVRDGALRSCTLAASHVFFDHELPIRTAVSHDAAGTWSFSVPDDMEISVKTLSATAKGPITLSVGDGGHLKGISSGSENMIVVRGVGLRTMNILISDGAALGELAEPFVVAGEQHGVGVAVRIDLASGVVSLAGPRWWLSE
jgi:hypothetical protein